MAIDHDTLIWFSKTFGLFYLIALSIAAVGYACWPANKARFDHAANSILHGEDAP